MTRTASRTTIERVMAWLDAMRRGDLDAAVACFAPDVVWEGLVPGVECANRDEVRDMLSESIKDDMDVQHLEVLGSSDRAMLGVRSAELEELAGVTLHGQLFNVFTIRDELIVRVRDFALRREAQEAAGGTTSPAGAEHRPSVEGRRNSGQVTAESARGPADRNRYPGAGTVGRPSPSRRSRATHSPDPAVRAPTIAMAPL